MGKSGGGKKGGGGSGGADIQSILNSLGAQSQEFQALGDYETQFLQQPYNIGNYYMDLATGGTGPQAYGTQMGYDTEGTTNYKGPGVGGYIGPYGPGGGGVGSGGLFTGGAGTGGTTGTGTTGGTTGTGDIGGVANLFAGGLGGNPWATGVEESLQSQANALPGMSNYANLLQSEAGTEFGNAQGEFGTAGTELSNAGTEFAYAQQLQQELQRNKGLFPDQQALIQAQVNAGQNQTAQQLASQGLSQSTMGKELASEIGLQGAATGGQLIQGNLGLVNQAYGTANQAYSTANQAYSTANQANQIANLANGTALSGQGQFFQELASIGQQSLTAQSEFFQQAMSGYGGAGAALQNVLNPYGYQLQDYGSIISGSLGNAQIMAGLQNTSTQAQASGLSGLFSGLGSLLGGSSSGGGLLGGLGLSSAGGGLAGVGSAIGSGASGLISGIGSAIGALFCEVARVVYGVDSPDWMLFRDWILFRAPKPVRTAYVIHAYRVSQWIKGRRLICALVRWTMNSILCVDSFTAKITKCRDS